MTNFDDFKQLAKDTMDTIADKSIEFYRIAEEKTKLLAKKTKLTAEITFEKGNIRKSYREIGNKYYDMNKEAPDDAFAQPVAEVTAAFERIAVKQELLDALKADTNFDVDFDDVQDCGCADTDDTAEPVAQDIEHEDLDENMAQAESDSSTPT